MTRTNQILVGALVVQTGLVALVWSSGTEHKLAKLEPIIAIDAGNVTKIEIYDRLGGEPSPPANEAKKEATADAAAKPAVVLAKESSGWVLASHWSYPVKANSAEDLIAKLEGMKSRGPVTTQESRHRQLRVAADRYERKLVIHAGGQPITLFVGSAAGRGKTAVRVDGSTEIFGVPAITSYSIGGAARSWVETEYFKKGTDAITQMVIKAVGGTYDLRRADGEADWKRFDGNAEVPVPEGKELDDGAVDALANKVGRITLHEPADPAKKGFAPQSTVTFKAGDKTHVLSIGDLTGDRYLIAVDDQVPVWANKSMLEELVSLTDDKVYRDPKAAADDAPPDGPPQLPPGLQLPPGVQIPH
jgi:hypothetical protein